MDQGGKDTEKPRPFLLAQAILQVGEEKLLCPGLPLHLCPLQTPQAPQAPLKWGQEQREPGVALEGRAWDPLTPPVLRSAWRPSFPAPAPSHRPPPLYLPTKAGSSRAGLQVLQSVEEELEALVCIKFAPRRLRMEQDISEKTRRAQSFITCANCLACAHACARTPAGDRASWPGSAPSCLCSVPSSLGLSLPICNPRDWRVCLQSLPSFLRLLSQAVLLL